jgi:hypothetical protein
MNYGKSIPGVGNGGIVNGSQGTSISNSNTDPREWIIQEPMIHNKLTSIG